VKQVPSCVISAPLETRIGDDLLTKVYLDMMSANYFGRDDSTYMVS